MNINEVNSDIEKTISLPLSSSPNNEINIQNASESSSEQCSRHILGYSFTGPDEEAPHINQGRGNL